jgi:hypothetical protein
MINRLLLIPLIFLLSASIGLCQEKQFQEDKDDAYEEMSSGDLTLRFYNALTGVPIAGAVVELTDIGPLQTDEEGKVRFPAPQEDAEYSFVFKASGYVTSELSFELMAGSIFQRRYSISPALDIRFLRIVLDWGSSPRDLDAHFVKEGGYHISYRNMKTLADGSGTLDRDAMTGYGPETITVKEVSRNASYRFFVHDYTNQRRTDSRALSGSKAMVKIFGEGKVLKTFRVPDSQVGTVWDVFQITNGRIVETNFIKNE